MFARLKQYEETYRYFCLIAQVQLCSEPRNPVWSIRCKYARAYLTALMLCWDCDHLAVCNISIKTGSQIIGLPSVVAACERLGFPLVSIRAQMRQWQTLVYIYRSWPYWCNANLIVHKKCFGYAGYVSNIMLLLNRRLTVDGCFQIAIVTGKISGIGLGRINCKYIALGTLFNCEILAIELFFFVSYCD